MLNQRSCEYINADAKSIDIAHNLCVRLQICCHNSQTTETDIETEAHETDCTEFGPTSPMSAEKSKVRAFVSVAMQQLILFPFVKLDLVWNQ